jgi:anti-sigma B factor antagonist
MSEPAESPDDAFSIVSHDGRIVVTGDVDADTAPLIARALAKLSGSVELDMSGVDFLDSSGLRILIGTHQSLEQRDSVLRIVDPSPAVLRIFQLTNVDGYLHISS